MDQGLQPALYIVLVRTAVPSGDRGVPCNKKAHGQQCSHSTPSAFEQRSSAEVMTQVPDETFRAWYGEESFTTPARDTCRPARIQKRLHLFNPSSRSRHPPTQPSRTPSHSTKPCLSFPQPTPDQLDTSTPHHTIRHPNPTGKPTTCNPPTTPRPEQKPEHNPPIHSNPF